VRTLAHYTQSPAEILAAMNQRMMARSHDGGFTTCLICAPTADGTVTVANAGHLAPYLKSKEMAIENGLPLGLEAKAVYTGEHRAACRARATDADDDGLVEREAGRASCLASIAHRRLRPTRRSPIAQAAQKFGHRTILPVLTLSRDDAVDPDSSPSTLWSWSLRVTFFSARQAERREPISIGKVCNRLSWSFMPTRNVNLTKELDRFGSESVKSGHYANAAR